MARMVFKEIHFLLLFLRFRLGNINVNLRKPCGEFRVKSKGFTYPSTMDPHGLLGHLGQLLPVELSSPGVVLLLGITGGTVVLGNSYLKVHPPRMKKPSLHSDHRQDSSPSTWRPLRGSDPKARMVPLYHSGPL
ncbi:hypothetical protein E2C01_019497 [Portunus trituberculatus]|uniref:Uncharacterized protein n=1 Tax=Portunus trituberculatus TaxID=210409 RepID=A0A5B7DZJ7_PORTR|nr:hypothetical protein [Portunus trituberculatus]